MDGPDCVQQLSKVGGIGRTSAANFKQHWDANKGMFDPSHAKLPDLRGSMCVDILVWPLLSTGVALVPTNT